MSLEYFKYRSGERDSYMLDSRGGPMQFRDGAALNFNLNLPLNMYWDNRVHMADDYSPQPRSVGWQWEAGLHFPWHMDVFEFHHSQHGMEYRNPRGDRFPVENTYGVRLHIIGGR